MIADFTETRIATLKRNINQFLSVCAYFKEFANGIKYIQAYDDAYEANMYFECQTDFGRFSCIYYHVSFYSHSIYIFHVTLTNGYPSIQFH